MMKARPYQTEAIDQIHAAFVKNQSTLLVLATGLGKTFVCCKVAEKLLEKGKVMMLAHRAELVYQARDQMLKTINVEPDIEMADQHSEYSFLHDSQVIVSTIQTQIAGMRGKGRMTKFNPDEFSLLILDECHHSVAQSHKKVIDYYRQNPNIKILGLTATPDRADELALGRIFESVAYEYGIVEGITSGWLVPIRQNAVYVDHLDFSECKTTAGDLNGADLAKVMEFEENLHGIASPTIKIIGERKTLLFAASLAHAERLTEIFNRHKSGCARWVHGKTNKAERKQLFRDYANNEFQILVNVGVATEGFDEPTIEVIVQARPTKSRTLYAQMVGRGTRVLPGVLDLMDSDVLRRTAIAQSAKRHLDVIDFVGNSGRHKLVNTADILGGNYNDDVVALASDSVKEKTGPVNMISELARAEQELLRRSREADEAAMRSVVIARAKYSTAKVNPFDILDVMPHRQKAWNKNRQPTEKQIDMLQRNGIDVSGLSFEHASQVIGEIINRRKNKKCTYKQAKLLKKYGYNGDYLFTEASKLIDSIAENGWRRPRKESA